MRKRIAEILSSADQDPISKPKPYIKRYFPKTYRILLHLFHFIPESK
jgi:hypothetical protein